MSEFQQYNRKEKAELRKVTDKDISSFKMDGDIIVSNNKDNPITVSISDVDLQNESPKIGDMIARNPKNHLDQWLIAEQYFKDNFEI